MQGQLIFAVEVTEQVRARRQTTLLQAEVLAGAQRRARERQDVLQVFANAPLAVAQLREPDHQLDYWNALFDQYFPGAERGVPLQQALPALATPEVVGQFDRLYKNDETYQSEPTRLPGATPGAALRYVTFTYQAYQESGQVAGVALFLQDVTEQVLGRQQVQHLNGELTATNQELLRSNTRLTRTIADLDTFIYTASHDLRSPVANLEGLLAALRQELLDEPLTKHIVEYLLTLIEGSINCFYVTVGQLTNLLHQQHQPGARAEQVDVAEVAEGVRLDLALLLPEAGGELLVDTCGCPTLHASVKDLHSIVLNMLSNAVKHRSPVRLLRVGLRTAYTEQWHELRVQDNGLGLSPAHQARLCTLFKRLHTHVEGSGVGLYAIKKLVENAGGTIGVEKEAGVGTTFSVRLPAWPGAGCYVAKCCARMRSTCCCVKGLSK